MAHLKGFNPDILKKRLVVGFSGGGDSTALITLLSRVFPQENVLCATLDHGLREGSDIEAQEAQKYAQSLGYQCLLQRVEVRELNQKRKKGLEEAGRHARYTFLEEARKTFQADYILTAHQAQDQAETILLKLIKGAGPGGFLGIGCEGWILRPLLKFTPEELRDYLRERKIPWREDLSNNDLLFQRNFVRLKILPLISQLNQKYLAAFERFVTIARAEEEFWELHLGELLKDLRVVSLSRVGSPSKVSGDQSHFEEPHSPGFKFLASPFEKLTLAEKRRVLGKLLRQIQVPGDAEPVTLASTQMAVDFLSSSAKGGIDLPGGRRVCVQRKEIILTIASRFLN
ncbi:MAG: tRNA lysidine(34) synthetase TilS [Deltaproteobacteria bacterium]|nr:tRNA lysidine(34) synthetase TilS [Deltaproteobacteria bacterium]